MNIAARARSACDAELAVVASPWRDCLNAIRMLKNVAVAPNLYRLTADNISGGAYTRRVQHSVPSCDEYFCARASAIPATGCLTNGSAT